MLRSLPPLCLSCAALSVPAAGKMRALREERDRLTPVVEAARRFVHDGENNEPIVQLEKALAQAVYDLEAFS
jgi:hypothetical protein